MYNILVFPAGTEIGLEIYRALQYCKDVQLFGANSDVPNHAPFVYKKYYTLRDIHTHGWIDELNTIIEKNKIDYIYPAYDDAIVALTKNQAQIKCDIIAPDFDISKITRSKIQTYRLFGETKLPIPQFWDHSQLQYIADFPIFIKPDIGQGSRGAKIVHSKKELDDLKEKYQDNIVACEVLTGDEYTVDCFSSKKKGIMYVGGRARIRCKNGISMTSKTVYKKEFEEYAHIIYEKLGLDGAWFFQVKYGKNMVLKLLEIAPRISGTMATNRVRGINFPLLSIYEKAGIDVEILPNKYEVYIDRALENSYKINIEYTTIYVDLDDTIVLNDEVNYTLVSFLYKSINENKKIILLTKHDGNLENTLKKYRIFGLFDEIIHIGKEDDKAHYIKEKNAIFIDDSFSERKRVAGDCDIPVFDLHMIESLF